jgi:hypothetical protein
MWWKVKSGLKVFTVKVKKTLSSGMLTGKF